MQISLIFFDYQSSDRDFIIFLVVLAIVLSVGIYQLKGYYQKKFAIDIDKLNNKIKVQEEELENQKQTHELAIKAAKDACENEINLLKKLKEENQTTIEELHGTIEELEKKNKELEKELKPYRSKDIIIQYYREE